MTSFSEKKSQELHDAIKKHDHDHVKLLLSDPEVDPEIEQGNKMTPFQNACLYGDLYTIRIFLDHGRSIDYNKPYVGCHILSFFTSNTPRMKMLLDDPRLKVGTNEGLFRVARHSPDPLGTTKLLLAWERLSMESVLYDLKAVYIREIYDLLEAYVEDPVSVRFRFREELGYTPGDAGQLFALVVLLCDGYLQIKKI